MNFATVAAHYHNRPISTASVDSWADADSEDALWTTLQETPANDPRWKTSRLRLHRRTLSTLPWIQLPELVISHLRQLDLSGNQLTQLPPALGQLHNLQELNLGFNRFQSVPDVIWTMRSHLEMLNLCKNQLTGDVPLEFRQMTALKSLKLAGNQLISISGLVLGSLSQLETLVLGSECVGGNLLTNLPAELGSLTALKRLEVTDNQLVELPEELGRLQSLEILNVSNNRIGYLPDTVGRLTRLCSLTIARNRVRKLPETLCYLDDLQMLDASNNNLQYLTHSVADFLGKRSVLLTGNPFRRQQSKSPTRNRSNTIKAVYLGHPDTISPVSTSCEQSSSSSSPAIQTVPIVGISKAGPRSLLELAARAVVQHGIRVEPGALPRHLLSYICNQGGSCPICERIFIGEFHYRHQSLVDLGVPEAGKQIRYCSERCWQAHSVQIAKETQEYTVTSPKSPDGSAVKSRIQQWLQMDW